MTPKSKDFLCFEGGVKTIAEKCIYEDVTDEEIIEVFTNASDKTKHLIEELTKENIKTMIIANSNLRERTKNLVRSRRG